MWASNVHVVLSPRPAHSASGQGLRSILAHIQHSAQQPLAQILLIHCERPATGAGGVSRIATLSESPLTPSLHTCTVMQQVRAEVALGWIAEVSRALVSRNDLTPVCCSAFHGPRRKQCPPRREHGRLSMQPMVHQADVCVLPCILAAQSWHCDARAALA